MRKDMTTKERKAFILALNEKINEFVHKKRLFAGGCCYSAYLLADILTRMGIKYNVVLFQSNENADETYFYDAVDGCDHVAIEVRIGAKRLIIGDYSGITDEYKVWNTRYVMRRYHEITPSMIFEAYCDNEWNWEYKTSNNPSLKKNLNRIAEKYQMAA